MILATDVHYEGNNAVAAGVVFDHWTASEPRHEQTAAISNVAAYEPGSFYKRELPCLLSLIHEVNQPIDIIIVDGFVTLGEEEKPGLGMHLYKSLNALKPIIGIAKTAFADTPPACEVVRGESIKPLYVTAAGMPLEEAKSLVLSMHGKYRLPTLLKRVDQLCRRGESKTT